MSVVHKFHFHKWRVVARVTPPLWDWAAKGILERCSACEKERAR